MHCRKKKHAVVMSWCPGDGHGGVLCMVDDAHGLGVPHSTDTSRLLIGRRAALVPYFAFTEIVIIGQIVDA